MALLAQNLPMLLFGFVAGAVADRRRPPAHDRRGQPRPGGRPGPCSRPPSPRASSSIAVVLVALFVLGTAETFADVGGSSLLPRLVRREDLGIANARLQGGVLLTNQLLTPPIGAFLFAVGHGAAVRRRLPPASPSARCSSPRIVLSAEPPGEAGAEAPGPAGMRRGHRGGPALAAWTTRRCGRSPSRSSPSTSRSARPGPCSSSTRRSGSAWATSGSACSRRRWRSAGSSGRAPTGAWSAGSRWRTSCAWAC